MKFVWWIAGIALILLAGSVLITQYEQEIAHSYIKIFPLQRDKSLTYWIDLTHLLFNEIVRLGIFAILVLLLVQYTDAPTWVGRLEATLLKRPSRTLAVILASFLSLSVFVAVYILDLFPSSSDEYAYLFQAEVFSRGKLYDRAHPLPEFFDLFHIAQVDGIWISRFPPGWPLLLMPAFAAGIPPWMVNPILGTVSLWVLYLFCKRFYSERVALWATIATAFTSTMIFNAASYFSHTSSFLELLLFVYFLYCYVEEKKIYQALLAGLFFGMLGITRYYTAFLIFIPFLVFLFWRLRLAAVPALIWVGLGALPPVSVLLLYNYQITGNPLLPVTMWAYDDESLGFVKGHTPIKGFEYILRRLMMFIAWASPAMLILYPVLLWQKIKSHSTRLLHPEDYGFVLLMVGYFFYYHHGGNQYGPRFYFEAIPFVTVFVVVKVLRMNTRWSLSMLMAGMVYAVVKIPVIAQHEYHVTREREDVYALAAKNRIHHSVIFLSAGTGLLRPLAEMDLTRNDKAYSNDVLYALDLKDKNASLMRFYKDRTFYRYERKFGDVSGRLVKVMPANPHLAGR